MDQTQLHQILIKYFDLEELRTLCFDLDVDYDSLRGEGTEGKARELIRYLDRRDHLPDLVKLARKLRPNAPWEDASAATADATPTSPRPGRPTSAEAESLRRQLASARENLRLIEERKAEYVMDVEVPLQLVKQEQALRAKIADLEERLGQ